VLRADIKPTVDGEAAHRAASPSISVLTYLRIAICFDHVLAKESKRLHRNEGNLSLILFDLDYFKLYNDCCGYLSGDTCLPSMAQAAQSVLKRPGDLVARYGGEEFAVILPHTDQAGAKKIACDI